MPRKKTVPPLDDQAFLKALRKARQPYQDAYRAMYSSVVDGIVTDPALMLVPVDDHMVHRGDAVFETLRIHAGAYYNLKAHLDRLLRSAERIELKPPFDRKLLTELCLRTGEAAGVKDAVVRVLLSRGPGSLGVNPYDSPKPQLYIVVAAFPGPFMASHPDGASVIASAQLAKPGSLTVIKSCNYLMNALLKKEAVDRGADYAVTFDEGGFLAEGATENAGIIDATGTLKVPPRGTVLDGTTMLRALELAKEADDPAFPITRAKRMSIHRSEIRQAREMLIFGTTSDITAVVSFEGRAIGNGKPGKGWRALHDALVRDMTENEALRTPVGG